MTLIKFILQRKAPVFYAFMIGDGAKVKQHLGMCQKQHQGQFITWQDSLNQLQKGILL
jgi:hypothetical protein